MPWWKSICENTHISRGLAHLRTNRTQSRSSRSVDTFPSLCSHPVVLRSSDWSLREKRKSQQTSSFYYEETQRAHTMEAISDMLR
ncbi:hypothetical protein KC361_g158 [Hortaea werneckii]|nr:hypothetical protein KC361_g158 [Hortaea werneckii]